MLALLKKDLPEEATQRLSHVGGREVKLEELRQNPSTQSASSGEAGMNCSWKLSNAHNVHLEVELSRLSTLFSTKPKSVSGEGAEEYQKVFRENSLMRHGGGNIFGILRLRARDFAE